VSGQVTEGKVSDSHGSRAIVSHVQRSAYPVIDTFSNLIVLKIKVRNDEQYE